MITPIVQACWAFQVGKHVKTGATEVCVHNKPWPCRQPPVFILSPSKRGKSYHLRSPGTCLGHFPAFPWPSCWGQQSAAAHSAAHLVSAAVYSSPAWSPPQPGHPVNPRPNNIKKGQVPEPGTPEMLDCMGICSWGEGRFFGSSHSNHSHHPWKLQADAAFSSLALPPSTVDFSISQEQQLVVPLSGSQPRPWASPISGWPRGSRTGWPALYNK